MCRLALVNPASLFQISRAPFVSQLGKALIPKRREPMTREMIIALTGTRGVLPHIHDGMKLGRTTLYWASPLGRSLRAALLLGARTGVRKAEISLDAGQEFDRRCASRANLQWHLGGRLYASPPRGLLESATREDFVIFTPPLSKSDQTGEVWGAKPIYLRHKPGDPTCPFAALRDIEVHDPVSGSARTTTPLFTSDTEGSAIKGSHLKTLLHHMLLAVVGPTRAKVYSFHSLRVYLACALLASGASAAQIMALCRWQSEESLAIYARLGEVDYTRLLERSLRADITSVSTANLPNIGSHMVLNDLYLHADAGLADEA